MKSVIKSQFCFHRKANDMNLNNKIVQIKGMFLVLNDNSIIKFNDNLYNELVLNQINMRVNKSVILLLFSSVFSFTIPFRLDISLFSCRINCTNCTWC